MGALVVDTHSAVWFLAKDPHLSVAARQSMRSVVDAAEPIYVSAISLVELTYLVEKGRLPLRKLHDLLKEIKSSGSNFELVPIDLSVTEALRKIPRSDVPDMPDRIVAATALHMELPLITRDRKIRSSGLVTIW